METLERRQLYLQHTKAAFAQENPFFRHITVRYPAMDSDWGQYPAEITVNGQTPGTIELRVRCALANPEADARLRAKGLTQYPDEDDPGFSVYMSVTDKATAEEIAGFIEWVFVVALDTPEDYSPVIRTPVSEGAPKGPATPKKGCAGGCRSVALALLWAIIALLAIRFLFAG